MTLTANQAEHEAKLYGVLVLRLAEALRQVLELSHSAEEDARILSQRDGYERPQRLAAARRREEVRRVAYQLLLDVDIRGPRA